MDKISDNSLVKKVLTLKSGKFVFSNRFNKQRLFELLIEAKILCRTINDLPILPDIASQLEEEVIRKSIFGTAAIEGNPLKEEQVNQILSKEELNDLEEKQKKAATEIQNLKFVYGLIKTSKPEKAPVELTEESIKTIHFTITQDIQHKYNIPGQYRSETVKVGDKEHGGVYTPPKILEDIKVLMKEFILWINSKELLEADPLIRAGLAHFYLGLIHPFSDGNGRTARIVESMLLSQSGLKYVPVMLSNYYYKNIDEYFRVFSISINSIKKKRYDLTPFLEFIIKGIVESEEEIKGKITFIIRKFTLRDYYESLRKNKKITQRQHDFLMVLLDNMKPFKLVDLFENPLFKVLYKNVSERTARRDIDKLLKMKLLISEDKGYKLHFRTLG